MKMQDSMDDSFAEQRTVVERLAAKTQEVIVKKKLKGSNVDISTRSLLTRCHTASVEDLVGCPGEGVHSCLRHRNLNLRTQSMINPSWRNDLESLRTLLARKSPASTGGTSSWSRSTTCPGRSRRLSFLYRSRIRYFPETPMAVGELFGTQRGLH